MYNIEEIKNEALQLVSQNNFPAIVDQSDFAKAGDVLKVVKKRIKVIEDKRKSYTDPLLKQQKLIKADFDLAAEPYIAFSSQLEEKMKTFWEAEKVRVDAAQLLLDTEASLTTLVDGVLVPIINDIKSTHGDIATTTVRKVTRWRLVDINAVPSKFLTTNDKVLNEYVREGGVCPSGIEYFTETSLTSR